MKKPEDLKIMDFYRRFLYEDMPDDIASNYDEDILIKHKIYDLSLV